MRHSLGRSKPAFTLVELLVVIAIIGTLVGLLLPAVQAARESARSNTCRNNLKQLQTAIIQRESSLGDFPGYINSLGVKGSSQLIRASWVVTTFPYIEQRPLWDLWSQGAAQFDAGRLGPRSKAQIELLICPSDPPTSAEAPLLSYVANAGWIQRSQDLLSGSVISNLPNNAAGRKPFSKLEENPANGVFFDRTRTDGSTGLLGPTDINDSGNAPTITSSTAYIQKGDGTSSTLMLAENLRTVYWAHDQEGAYSAALGPDRKYHFGFCWEQPNEILDGITSGGPKQYWRINAFAPDSESVFENYTEVSELQPQDAFPTSNHPSGINVAFVGGAVQFLSDQIEPRVFAQLMTSNRNTSDLHIGGQYEKDMAPLGQGDY